MEASPPMHRQPLLALLAQYHERHPEDAERTHAVIRFVREHRDCFERACVPGHVTASAWIVSPSSECVLLARHRRLGRWLQLGGHADGDPNVFAVALREAREESGLTRLAPFEPDGASSLLDVDVHEIPAYGAEPAHLHHDVRFLLRAEPGQELRISPESTALSWVRWIDLAALGADESLLRMARRALERAGVG